jgi:DNA-binding transcriptional regulator YhcF (GntR family)
MIITIDETTKQPPYEQIRARITTAIATGEIAKGTRLPSIRQLAGDLGLANNTVARAYRELEIQGLVRSLGRRGTTVVGLPADVTDHTALQLAKRFVNDVSELGLGTPTILALVAQATASHQRT